MFVYSLRASTLKFFAVVCVALTALITMITFIPEYDAGELGYITTGKEEKISYDKIKTEEDRIEFLKSLGWEIKTDGALAEKVTVPSEFDSVFAGYNDIQKQQGLDLSRYKRKEVMHYRYEITNYKDHDGTVYVNLLVYRGRVIGGDISSASPGGFVKGLRGE